MSNRSRALLVLLFLSTSATTLAAQGFTGGVRGTVRDANGVIPGADVTLTNEATSATRQVVTNSEGIYAFENVLPGTYAVRASLAGFRPLERAGIPMESIVPVDEVRPEDFA